MFRKIMPLFPKILGFGGVIVGASIALSQTTFPEYSVDQSALSSVTDVVAVSNLNSWATLLLAVAFVIWASAVWMADKHFSGGLSPDGFIAKYFSGLAEYLGFFLAGGATFAICFTALVATFLINLLSYWVSGSFFVFGHQFISQKALFQMLISGVAFSFVGASLVRYARGDGFAVFRAGSDCLRAKISHGRQVWHLHFVPKGPLPSELGRAASTSDFLIEEAKNLIGELKRLGRERPQKIIMDSFLLADTRYTEKHKAVLQRVADEAGYTYEYPEDPIDLSPFQRWIRAWMFHKLRSRLDNGLLDKTRRVTLLRSDQ
ncbi:hypothetical protein OZ656_06545 [Marinobacter sp. LM1]|jgi:hypothetical protein|uniref:hypothetical protein n=1 Tax=Marinobacter sp. LM1 TaxID=3003349 RepID=UPI0036D3742A|tara:strand:+ start:460 stop:1413 length:954 start_codon:yes stop_codon:yes gene_type:complete